VKLQGVVSWFAFKFLKPFGYKLLGVFFKFQSDGYRFRFIWKIFHTHLGDSTEMRYLFSQDSAILIEFITERWFYFSGQKHGQGIRDSHVTLCPPARSCRRPLRQCISGALQRRAATVAALAQSYVPQQRCAAALQQPLLQHLHYAFCSTVTLRRNPLFAPPPISRAHVCIWSLLLRAYITTAAATAISDGVHAIAHYAATATSTRRRHLHPKPSITSPPSRVNSPRRVVKLPSCAPALGNRQLGHSPTRQPATLRLGHSAAAHAPKLHARLLALSTRSKLRSRRPYATPLAAHQHGRASASQHRHTAAPQQHDQYSISTSTTSTASAPAATAARPAHHQHQQLHSRRPRHPSPARRRTSSPHITSASAHRHSQAPFRSKLVPMPQYADSPNPSRLFNSAASAMNAAGASFAPHRRSPVLRRTRPCAHDRVVSRLLPRCIASHRIAMMRLQMKTLGGALSSCKSVALE